MFNFTSVTIVFRDLDTYTSPSSNHVRFLRDVYFTGGTFPIRHRVMILNHRTLRKLVTETSPASTRRKLLPPPPVSSRLLSLSSSYGRVWANHDPRRSPKPPIQCRKSSKVRSIVTSPSVLGTVATHRTHTSPLNVSTRVTGSWFFVSGTHTQSKEVSKVLRFQKAQYKFRS